MGRPLTAPISATASVSSAGLLRHHRPPHPPRLSRLTMPIRLRLQTMQTGLTMPTRLRLQTMLTGLTMPTRLRLQTMLTGLTMPTRLRLPPARQRFAAIFLGVHWSGSLQFFISRMEGFPPDCWVERAELRPQLISRRYLVSLVHALQQAASPHPTHLAPSILTRLISTLYFLLGSLSLPIGLTLTSYYYYFHFLLRPLPSRMAS